MRPILLFIVVVVFGVAVGQPPPVASTFRPPVAEGSQPPLGFSARQIVAAQQAGVNNQPNPVVVPPEPDYGDPSTGPASANPSTSASGFIPPEDFTDFTPNAQEEENSLLESTSSVASQTRQPSFSGSSADPIQRAITDFTSSLSTQARQQSSAYTTTVRTQTELQSFAHLNAEQQRLYQPEVATVAWPQPPPNAAAVTGYSAPSGSSIPLYPAPVPVPPPSQPSSYTAPAPPPYGDYGSLPPTPGYRPQPVQPVYIPGPSPVIYSTEAPQEPTWGPALSPQYPPAQIESPAPQPLQPPSDGYPSQPLGEYNQIAVPQTATYSDAVGGYSYQVNQQPVQQQLANYQVAPSFNDGFSGSQPLAPPPAPAFNGASGQTAYGVASIGYNPTNDGNSQVGYVQQSPTPDFGQGYGNAPVQAGVVGVLGASAVDTTDPCFRRYANCIIVNAQPYERRSSTSLAQCKSHCLSSQNGIYSCRSFVFDNVNQVCDLFAHVGNQPPARLLQFQSRDYFEPTGVKSGCSVAVPAPGVTTAPGFSAAAPVDGAPVCEPNEVTKYLRIEGFQLQDNDDVKLTGLTVEKCIEACTNNVGPSGEAAACQSFDFAQGTCIITLEAGVPLGNGQLTQNANSDYYEKICVPNSSATGCPLVFDRFPQMILVGFAETVVDASTFEQCLDNCLNSQTLYGFRCTSGMFYFEEPQLNCILNTEDRTSQPDLFTEENVDIVDYFETGCTIGRAATRLRNSKRKLGRRQYGARSAVLSDVRQEVKKDGEISVFVRASKVKEASKAKSSSSSTQLPNLGEWTEWSSCDRPKDGRRARYRRCENANVRECPVVETQWCNRETMPHNVLNQDALNFAQTFNGSGVDTNKFKCPPNVCCPVFGGCRIGLEQFGEKKIRWCTNPCEKEKDKTN